MSKEKVLQNEMFKKIKDRIEREHWSPHLNPQSSSSKNKHKKWRKRKGLTGDRLSDFGMSTGFGE